MKKIGLTITGLALAGIMAFGVNNNLEFSTLNKGDTPAPQRPDLAYNVGDTPAPTYSEGHTGGISKLEEHGDYGGAPANADGNTGSPAYDHGRPPAPTNTHSEAI
ncbi:Phr family secreted Rap phosphatase inhibitor [Bacillus sp. DX4.1]|uniref:Phr family secreted Rap phosphatase inhibitor n=1 Tax=Bacillus sp. DX4.1 TaxID=3055867 RepID=UPI0025A1E39C|nr:Phr family secreted Rap phosphatase inhibitor [Bacillus sp. DX4.1]MDM5189884.1 Phr family secreted Rap phosphatase inhibitor [Bacillus sp. DX4.1]